MPRHARAVVAKSLLCRPKAAAAYTAAPAPDQKRQRGKPVLASPNSNTADTAVGGDTIAGRIIAVGGTGLESKTEYLESFLVADSEAEGHVWVSALSSLGAVTGMRSRLDRLLLDQGIQEPTSAYVDTKYIEANERITQQFLSARAKSPQERPEILYEQIFALVDELLGKTD